ncbi:L-threonine dehydratase catabolic TdcB [Candidatus Sulfotelmatobacter kueseliae]|uniref:L-threonine dehydratase catabolic TdcB n=1 Tax=Candidatus Sulfotelmatobacter kueseliae TaxID=2042962 RepID=A0A2U3KW19_9BACT|nr:L-threonine dehydratase catabolic TdcB [Candidatus Sulfotelmatobacter kueseliae]
MIALSDIQAALGKIRADIRVSPCPRSEAFSGLTHNTIFLKLDNQQRTGAFKERGALNKLLTLNPEERARGVIAASAGNHAQGVAYHAGRHGIRARIFMPLPTPLTKVSATRAYGAEVVLDGANYDEAFAKAVENARQDGLTLIHAFDDDTVIAGQGTLGLEILEQHPSIEVIVAPIGGGGLIGGIGCAVKESNPKVRVFGVQPAKLPSMKAAVAEGKPVTLKAATTIADGIAVRRAGDRTLPLVQKYVDDIVTVEEEEIANAILLLLEREKTLAEGAGAAALAAVLNRKLPLEGKKVAVLVCGGNIDVTLLARIIERGLVKDGRLVRLRVHLPDYPGALHRLTGILADHRANIVETAYDRAYHGVNLGDTAIDITMETRGPDHIAELLAALETAGYTHERIL